MYVSPLLPPKPFNFRNREDLFFVALLLSQGPLSASLPTCVRCHIQPGYSHLFVPPLSRLILSEKYGRVILI